ncbi:phosphotransferase system lactose/cellobiose-specific IIB subunit [Candidatus Arthromitus sp. SFB-mouse-Yit]|nr:phosphotransferase system lactose/cellobiose-specific IIB subunit [Candidatus Arthromitus sp. SFB-mouse-Yit]
MLKYFKRDIVLIYYLFFSKSLGGFIMVKVLLVCSAGMSTSLMVTKMKDSAKAKGIEAEIWAVSESEAIDNLPNADVLLLGPQVRFLESKMKGLAGDKPVAVIDMQAYGTMNGEKVLEQALNLLGN